MNLYKKYTKIFLVIDTTLASDNPLKRIYKLIMAIVDKIRDEKLQYDIKRETAKISASSSGKIFYGLRNTTFPFTYYTLGKVFEKQIKTIEDQGQKASWNFKNFKISRIKTGIGWRNFCKKVIKQWN